MCSLNSPPYPPPPADLPHLLPSPICSQVTGVLGRCLPYVRPRPAFPDAHGPASASSIQGLRWSQPRAAPGVCGPGPPLPSPQSLSPPPLIISSSRGQHGLPGRDLGPGRCPDCLPRPAIQREKKGDSSEFSDASKSERNFFSNAGLVGCAFEPNPGRGPCWGNSEKRGW